MKRIILTTLALLVVSIVAKAIEIVPQPSVMKVGQEEVRLRSIEPSVSVSEELESEEYRLEVTPDGMIRWIRFFFKHARRVGRIFISLSCRWKTDRPSGIVERCLTAQGISGP